MLVERVRIIDDHGHELVLRPDGLSEQGWGLASAEAGTLEGWWTPPAPRAEATDRPQADGAYAPASLLVGARVLTIVAHHDTGTPDSERRAREEIARVCRGGLRVVVEESGRTSHVRGFVSEQVEMTHRSSTRSTWSLILTCPDPLIYGGPGDDGDLSSWESSEGVWSLSPDGGLLFPVFDQTPTVEATTSSTAAAIFTGGATSSLTVTNDGTAASWPVLEVAGPVDWARWVLDGHEVQWSQPVPEGMVLRISTADGAVSVGGERVGQGGLTRDDFFQVPPGVGHVEVSADRPALMRVRWRTAWI